MSIGVRVRIQCLHGRARECAYSVSAWQGQGVCVFSVCMADSVSAWQGQGVCVFNVCMAGPGCVCIQCLRGRARGCAYSVSAWQGQGVCVFSVCMAGPGGVHIQCLHGRARGCAYSVSVWQGQGVCIFSVCMAGPGCVRIQCLHGRARGCAYSVSVWQGQDRRYLGVYIIIQYLHDRGQEVYIYLAGVVYLYIQCQYLHGRLGQAECVEPSVLWCLLKALSLCYLPSAPWQPLLPFGGLLDSRHAM